MTIDTGRFTREEREALASFLSNVQKFLCNSCVVTVNPYVDQRHICNDCGMIKSWRKLVSVMERANEDSIPLSNGGDKNVTSKDRP